MTATAKPVDLLYELLAAADGLNVIFDEYYFDGEEYSAVSRFLHALETYRRSSPADARVVTTDDMIEEALCQVESYYPTSAFPENGKSIDCLSASMARQTCRNVRHELKQIKDRAAERARPLSVDPMQQVIATVRAYLPPDGISKDEFVARIIGIVDPGEDT